MRNGACLEPRAIAKAPEGQGCPRCGGYVYAAEQMLARGRVSDCYAFNVFCSIFDIFRIVKPIWQSVQIINLIYGIYEIILSCFVLQFAILYVNHSVRV